MAHKKKFPKLEIKPKPLPESTNPDGIEFGECPHLTEYLPELKTGDKYFHSTWASPESFARHIKTIDEKKCWNRSAWDEGELKWRGSKSMEETLDLAENGWREGMNKVLRVSEKITISNPVLPKAIKYGITGAYPDVPRAIAGNPLNMRAIDLAKSRRKPVITIVSNMSASCSIDADLITNRAAVVAAIIDRIEAEGYACEVITTATTTGSSFYGREGFRAATTIVIKKSNQPVDVGRLAFGLGHASMFRRMIFADWSSAESCREGIGVSLGSKLKHVQIEELIHKGVYWLDSIEGLSKKFETEEIAETEGLAYLLDELRKQRCPPFVHLEPLVKEEDD